MRGQSEAATAVGERTALERGGDGPSDIGPGTMVDHFKVTRLLGRGGMGEVYLAYDTELGRNVALKVVGPGLLSSEQAVERFVFEARTTARFNHPNIVTLYAVGKHRGAPYVALEYLKGQNLRARMSERRLSLAEILRIGLAIAEAVDEAHQHGVLHRDLKPENVLIPPDGRPRVVDFGLAKELAATELAALRRDADEARCSTLALPGPTSPGEKPALPTAPRSLAGIKGTPEYMAPEQWLERECSGATDVWAIGVILFELLTDRLPYDEATLVRQAFVVCAPDRAPRVESLAETPAELAALVARCLEKSPPARPSARDVADALQQLLVGDRPSIATPKSPFRGLLPFTEAEAALFFGREPEVTAFVERVWSQPVLPVVGPSGAGKSSFVQAGVIPRLRDQERWLVLAMRPGRRPFEALAGRLLQGETLASRKGVESRRRGPDPDDHITMDEGDVGSLAERLARSPGQLSLELRAIAEEQGAKVMLLVDQLEELFTLGAGDEERRSFLEAVCAAAEDPLDPVRVVFCVRDDYLGRLSPGPKVRVALEHVTVIQSLEQAALEQILLRPARAVGYAFEDERLVPEMIGAVQGEPACLPLIQFTAQLLWERRDEQRRLLLRSVYEDIGGVAGALARHADGVLDALPPAQLELARVLLLRLVTADRTRKVVSRAEALAGLEQGPAAQVLGRLVEARLVSVSRVRSPTRPGDDDSDSALELAHESLIHSWRTLSQWLDESRAELAFLAEAEQAAKLWDGRGRRPEELWQGRALGDAMQMLECYATPVPELVAAFLQAARHRAAWRFRRQRLLLASVMGALGAIALVLAFQKRAADDARDRAEQSSAEARRSEARALEEGASAALAQGDALSARAKLRSALELQAAATPSARALWWQLETTSLVWVRELGAAVYAVAFAPDASVVAVASQDRAIYLLDARTSEPRVLRGHEDQVFALAWAPGARRLASGDWGGRIRLWDVASGRAEKVLTGHRGGVSKLSFSADGKQVASAGQDGTVRLWDATAGAERRVLTGHEAAVHAVGFSVDGRLLASGGADGNVRLWDATTGAERRVLRLRAGPVFGVAFSPDGKLVASGNADQTVRLADVATGAERRVLAGHGATVRDVSFSPDGKLVASGSDDRTARLWDVATGKERRVLVGHREFVRSVSFSPDGRLLASGSADRSVRLWSLYAAEEPRPLAGHAAATFGVAFSPDGQLVASTGRDNGVRLWDVSSGRERSLLVRHTDFVRTVAFSPDGRLVVLGSYDGTVRFWDLAAGREVRVLVAHAGRVEGVTFAPDGRLVASTGWDSTVRLWEAQSGEERHVLLGHTNVVRRASFSPDGRLLASASWDGTIRLWDVESGTARRVLSGHAGAVWGVDFGPDGSRLASAGEDKTVRLWDVASGTATVLGRHPGRLYDVAFHPDGARVGAASADGAARIWTVPSGEHVVLRGHDGEVNDIAFSADGQLAATTSDDQTVRLWRVGSARPLWHAPALLGSPPRLLSHRGWEQVETPPSTAGAIGSPVTPATIPKLPGPRVRQTLAERAWRGAESAESQLLCVHTFDDGVEAWDLAGDRLLARRPIVGLEQVLALPEGCAARAPGGVTLLDRSGRATEVAVEGRPTAIGTGAGGLLVAAGGTVSLVDRAGKVVERFGAGVEIAALAWWPEGGGLAVDGHAGTGTSPAPAGALHHRRLVVGYADGNIELAPTRPDEAKESCSFEQVPASPPVRMLLGPMDTLIVGYANGELGLWSLTNGARLAHAYLHGAVVHLLLEGHKLYAASALGAHVLWDLSVFHLDHCELLRRVWREVPVVWRHGKPVVSGPPAGHRCAR